MADTRTVATRFCSFAAPEHWLPLGAIGLADERAEPPRASAAVNECWVDPPQPLPDLAAEHFEKLRADHPGTAVVSDEPCADGRHPEAHRTVFRVPTAGGEMLLQNLLVMHGPLVCTLVTTRPAASRTAGELDAAIVASFEVTAAAWARDIRREPLAASPPATPESTAIPLPQLHVAVPVPAGWTLDRDTGRLRAGSAAIALVHHAPAKGDPESHFTASLEHLHRSDGWRPTAWDRGELPGQRDYWGLAATHASQRRWGQAEQTFQRQLFVAQDGVLELCLTAPAPADADTAALLEVATGLQSLPAQERRLVVARPWLSATLEGPWSEEAPGLFVRAGGARLAAMAAELPRRDDPATTARRAAKDLARQTDGAQVIRQELVDGIWQGRAITHLALAWHPPGEAPEHLRSAWLDGGEQILWLLVRGGLEPETDAVYKALLERADPGRAQRGGRE